MLIKKKNYYMKGGIKMELTPLAKHIYYLEHNPEVDRPMLGYVKGDKYSLAIDAGYSAAHVQDFYHAIESKNF